MLSLVAAIQLKWMSFGWSQLLLNFYFIEKLNHTFKEGRIITKKQCTDSFADFSYCDLCQIVQIVYASLFLVFLFNLSILRL